MKTCIKCDLSKDEKSFELNRNCCRACRYLQLKKTKKYKNNSENRRQYLKKYYRDHKDKAKENKKQYYLNNKERMQSYRKKYNDLHKEEMSKYKKNYYLDNKEKILKKHKEYRDSHKEQSNENKRKYSKNRVKIDLLYRVNLLPPKGGSFMFHRLFTRRRLNMFLFNVRLRTTTRHFC